MAENNQTNDIAEMLMRLRQSVEADRAKAEKGEESPVRRADGEKDELELQLEGLTRGLSATKKEAKAADIEEADAEEDDSDPWYDEEPEELDEDEFEEDESEEDVDIEIASDEERESEEDEADPWFTVEKKEEPIEEEPIEEEPIEEEPIEEEPIEEEPIEEEPIEEEPIYPDDDEPLTPEMIMESEEDEPKGDEEDDLPSWYAEETEREAPGRRSDDIDDGEGETFFDFDDNAYGSGMILSEPEEDTEEPTPEIEAEYTEDPTPEIEAEYIEEPTPEIEEENIEESVPEIKEEEDTEEPTPEIEADCIEDPVPEIEEEEDTEEPVHEIEDEEESLFLELKQMAALEDSDTVLDSTDLGLLRNLGYAAPEAENEPPSRTETESTDNGTDGDVAYDYDGGEYVIRGQVGEIRTGYMAKKRGILMRLTISAVASLLLMVYELLAFAEVGMPGIFDWKAFPLSHIMISLQFLVIAAAVSLKPIAKGIADAFCLRPTPYSVAGISVLVNLAYTIVVASVLPDGFVLFNFPAALAVTAATAYEYALWLIERKCFDCISSDNGQLYALVGDFEGQRPFGDEPTQRAYRTDFVKNYFDRTGKRSKEYKYLSVLIPASVLAGLLAMAIVWIATGDGNSGGAAAMLVMGFALPVGVMGTFSLPLLAVILSLKGRGAIIGHSAADEYEKTRFVTFDETDLFPTIKTTYIDLKPSGNRNISEVLGKTSRLFRSIGGPLSRMVEGKDIRPGAPEAEITGIFDDGISAIVDSSEMLVGGARFMELKGVDLSAPRDHRDADPAGEILYVAIEGRLAARYYIKYLPDEDLVSAVNSLGDRGICVGLRTRNPGVNSRIIEARCPELKYKVYTIKSVPDEERELDSYRGTVDSGIVVKDRAAGLARPLAAAISLKKYYKLDRILRFVLAALGAVIFAATAIMGRITDISSALVAAYQLAGLIPPAVAAAILYLRNK